MKKTISIETAPRLTLASLVLLTLVSCSPDPAPDNPTAGKNVDPEGWQCRNDLEVLCAEGRCEAEDGGGFTPMSVEVDTSGAISVCAYSGCWEGTGEVFSSREFLVVIARDLEFSTAPDLDSAGQDLAFVLDHSDTVATLKAGAFAHPLLCEGPR